MQGHLSFAVLFGASVGRLTHNRMGWKGRPLNQVYSYTGAHREGLCLARFRLTVSSPFDLCLSVCKGEPIG